jgi:hypothetical protein
MCSDTDKVREKEFLGGVDFYVCPYACGSMKKSSSEGFYVESKEYMCMSISKSIYLAS